MNLKPIKKNLFFGDNRIKELTPGIQTKKEKASFEKMSSHKSQLKNEELFFRVLER